MNLSTFPDGMSLYSQGPRIGRIEIKTLGFFLEKRMLLRRHLGQHPLGGSPDGLEDGLEILRYDYSSLEPISVLRTYLKRTSRLRPSSNLLQP